MSTRLLRVLIVEDVEDDALLLVRELKKGGFDVSWARVDSPADMRAALADASWEIVISDYKMPSFTGMDALRICRELRPDLPFIITSGTVGEDVAVEAMLAGANDYLMKGAFARLVPAVQRELKEALVGRERHAAQSALVESEANLARAQEVAHIGNWSYDFANGRTHWSDEMFRIFGMDPDPDGTGLLHPPVHPDDVEHRRRNAENLKTSGSSNYDYRIMRTDGEVRWVHDQAELRCAPDGTPLMAFGTTQDITDRKRAEEQLREDDQKYRAIVEAFDGFVYICSPDYTIEFMNERLIQRTGRDATGEKCYAALHDLADICPWCVNNRVQQGETVRWEVQSPKDNRWYYCVNTPIRHADGTVSKQSMILDITERKFAESRLAASERRFRELFDNMTSGVCVYEAVDNGADFIFRDVNKASLRIEKLAKEDLVGRRISQVFPGVREFGLLDVMTRVFKTGTPEHHGIALYQDERIQGWRENYVYKLPTGEVVCLYEDVTARKKAEEGLSRLGAAVNAADESIIITDTHGRILYVNPCFERMTGYRWDEVVGKPTAMLGSGKHTDKFYDELWAAISSGKPWRGHFINRKKDGTLFEEDAVISPVFDAAGKTTNFVAVKRDVTRQVMLETQLRHSQKMDALGRLAGGVAHDFTSKLLIILNSALMAKKKLAADSPLHMFMDQIVDAANRSSALTSELLAFANQRPLTLRRGDLNKAVQGVREIIGRTVDPALKFGLRLADHPLMTSLDSEHIEQVLVHLIVNARDAMPDGGELTVETSSITLSPEEAVQLQPAVDFSERVAGSFAVVTVSDSGCGMPPEIQSHVFDPFFTTKGHGKSSGLGLSTAYGIVKQHNGFITVYSRVGQGTTFKIFIPLLDGEPGEPEAPEIPAGRTVLLVDNDPLARALLAQVLKRHHLYILEAESGAEAISLLKDKGGAVDLLITDLTMPELGGQALQEKIRTMYPMVRTVFTSAYPEAHLLERGVLHSGDAFIGKPVSSGQTLRALQRAFAG